MFSVNYFQGKPVHEQSSKYNNPHSKVGRLLVSVVQVKGKGNSRINSEIRDSLSRKRITFSLQYLPTQGTYLPQSIVARNDPSEF